MREKAITQRKGGEFSIFCNLRWFTRKIYGVGEQAHYNSHDKYGTCIPRPRVYVFHCILQARWVWFVVLFYELHFDIIEDNL